MYHTYLLTKEALKITDYTGPRAVLESAMEGKPYDPLIISFKPAKLNIKGLDNLYKYEIDPVKGLGEKSYFYRDETEWLGESFANLPIKENVPSSIRYHSNKWLLAFFQYRGKYEIVIALLYWMNFISQHISELKEIGFWIHYNTEVYYMEEQHFTNVKSHTLSFENLTPNDLLGIEEDDILFITLDK